MTERDLPCGAVQTDSSAQRNRVELLASGLRNILGESRLEIDRGGFIHKNDKGLGKIMSTISEGDVISNKTRVGLIVGNGAALSVIPHVPADVIVTTDKNLFVHQWTLFSSKALLQTESPKAYRARVYSDQNPWFREMPFWHQSLSQDELRAEMEDLGDLHFLASQERFTQCREALQRKPLLSWPVDLLAARDMENFAMLLGDSDAEITFANMTNVWEDAGEGLASTMPLLPFNPEAMVLFSSRHNTQQGEVNVQNIQRGLSSYIASAREANAQWRNHALYGPFHFAQTLYDSQSS